MTYKLSSRNIYYLPKPSWPIFQKTLPSFLKTHCTMVSGHLYPRLPRQTRYSSAFQGSTRIHKLYLFLYNNLALTACPLPHPTQAAMLHDDAIPTNRQSREPLYFNYVTISMFKMTSEHVNKNYTIQGGPKKGNPSWAAILKSYLVNLDSFT